MDAQIDDGNFHFTAVFLITPSAFVSEDSSAVLVKAKGLHCFSSFSTTGLSLLPFASTQYPLPVFFLLQKDFSMAPW